MSLPALLLLLTLITGVAITWYRMTDGKDRTYANNQTGIDPLDRYSMFLQWLLASLIGFLLLDAPYYMAGGIWNILTYATALLAIGGIAGGLLFGIIAGYTIPYPGYRRPWWKEIYTWHRANHQAAKNLHKVTFDTTINPNPRSIADTNTAVALRSYPLPTNTTTTPTVCEYVNWSKTPSDETRRILAPYNNKEKLRIRGTITGPFTFTGAPPKNVHILRGPQRFYPHQANLTPTNTRTVDLVIDHRVIVAAQIHQEDFTRRHNWVLSFTNITPAELTLTTTDGTPCLIFGAPNDQDYTSPIVFTPTPKAAKKLTQQNLEDAMQYTGFDALSMFGADGTLLTDFPFITQEQSFRAQRDELDYYTLEPFFDEEDRKYLLDAVDQWEAEQAQKKNN